ncbi:MAG: 4-hydroxy-tetrahydrodipicolinate reductase [Clostridia bacterium]|nr:4-hydroxy-tetrahydrodipicolinate reductase [Clostridia bacterium]
MIRVLVHGSNGKMGGHVINQLKKTEGMCLMCGVDHVTTGKEDYPYFDSFDKVTEVPDVIIDFSFHTLVKGVLEYAIKVQRPVVIATTALDDDDKSMVARATQKIPVFLAANMSFGIALLCDFAKKAAEAFPDADIEIVEAHHNRKIDAPSGTAIMLANSIKEARPEAEYVFGRGGEAKRTKNEIGIHALRMANIVGEHEVYITTDSQQLVLRHNAYDRSLFADGAIKAARFLAGQEKGLYSMHDMFKTK